jgi:hypothetical protein
MKEDFRQTMTRSVAFPIRFLAVGFLLSSSTPLSDAFVQRVEITKRSYAGVRQNNFVVAARNIPNIGNFRVDPNDNQIQKPLQWSATAASLLAFVLATTEPALAATAGGSATAAQIHLNSLPPSTISVQIDDLPFIGGIFSGTYSKVDSKSISSIVQSSSAPPVTIQSPTDKVLAVKNAATGGHLEFDVDGLLETHVDVDVAASKAGVAAIHVESPLIPRLPFRNEASSLIPPGASALKMAQKSKPIKIGGPTAAHISLNSLPPTAISVEIEDLPVLGKALSGVYTKVEDLDVTLTKPASVIIESPKNKVAAIKAIASTGHFEFDVDGVINTHLDVDVATDSAGSATIRVASPLIPALPYQNAASY